MVQMVSHVFACSREDACPLCDGLPLARNGDEEQQEEGRGEQPEGVGHGVNDNS